MVFLVLVVISGCSTPKAELPEISTIEINAENVVVYVKQNLDKGTFPSLKSNFKFLDSSNFSFWWTAKDNTNVYLEPILLIGASIPVSSFDLTPTVIEELNFNLSPIVSNIDASLTDLGFTKSLENSSKDLADQSMYDYILAYENNDTKCSFILNRDFYISEEDSSQNNASILFTCSDQFQSNYEYQKQYVDALTQNELINGNEIVVYDVTNHESGFFTVAFAQRRTGAYAILRTTDDGLEVLYTGQESPYCSLVEEYQIPFSAVNNCYNQEGTELLLNPNR